MTPAGKAYALEGWERAKRDRAFSPPSGFVGGHGYPDPEIYDYVDRLNQLSRVCTLQSCAGHVCTPESHCDGCADALGVGIDYLTAEQRHIWNGQLWLWLDEQLAAWVHQRAPWFGSMAGIEKLGTIFHVDGMEIWDIQFRGAGHGELEASMLRICRFLEEGTQQCNLVG